MSPHRLKARGGAGGKISLPPPSISPPLTCKILQERRALRKLFGPPHLADHPVKPSLLPARRVPINTKEMTRQKKVSAIARLATTPSHKHIPCRPFKKPFYVGSGFSASIMPCRSVSEVFCATTRLKRNSNVNVCSTHTGKPDVPQPRLACCKIEKHLMAHTPKHTDHEIKNNPAQKNSTSTSTSKAGEGRHLLSNDFGMQCSYDVELNEDDCDVNLQEKTSGQYLPSIVKSNYDKDQVSSRPSSFCKMEIGEHLKPHNKSPRRSGNRDMMFDTCADVNTCRIALHSNAYLQKIDRSRDAQKMSGSLDDQAVVDCCCGDSNGCKNESRTHTSIQEFGDTDRSMDLNKKTRILSNDASNVFDGICTPQSKATSQEFHATDSSANAGQTLRSVSEAIFDNPCKFTSHWYARPQECDDAQMIAFKKPRSSDYEAISSPKNHGSPIDGDACKFVSQVNAILQESDDNRIRSSSSNNPRSHPIEQAVFESPWHGVDVYEFALHESFADCQESDDIDSSANARMTKREQNSMLSIQVTSSDIDNTVEIGKRTSSIQAKLALLEGSVSKVAANLKKTSDQLDAKIHNNVVLLSCIQSKLFRIEGLVTKMEACNCEDLRD